MRILSIVGARPQFVKLAPVSRELARRMQFGASYEDLIVHTGQHYDRSMSDVFFDELEIPETYADLGIGSGSHGQQTGTMLSAIETILEKARPRVVVVYGDTNSTLAGCLAAAKLQIPLIHVEAGLRSFNRMMPEEINRVVADHTSDLLLAPTPAAVENLKNENLIDRCRRVGDVMHDAVLHAHELASSRSTVLEDLSLSPKEYGLVTIHRAENTTAEVAGRLFDTLHAIVESKIPLVFPVHPRTRALLERHFRDQSINEQLLIVEPLGYFDMVRLLAGAKIMLTDSGGVQKEAMFLDTPCVTLRNETEWVETVTEGANRLAGTERARILACVDEVMTATEGANRQTSWQPAVKKIFGDGNSAAHIVDAIDEFAAEHSCA